MVNIHARDALIRFNPSGHHRYTNTALRESGGTRLYMRADPTVPNPSRCNQQH
jgi:hypothetical protein